VDGLDPGEQLGDLVHAAPVGTLPVAPLLAVDRTELARRPVGPLIPDRDPVLVKEGDVGGSLEEPDQLDHYLPERHPLRRHKGEPVEPVTADLTTAPPPRP